MIKASELRIGNILNVFGTNGNPEGWRVIKITAQHIVTCSNHPEWFDGIPLTSDKFERCGFVKDKGECWNKDKITLHFFDGSFWYFYTNWDKIQIASLHQIQNLYYVLTDGEELQIDLSVQECDATVAAK